MKVWKLVLVCSVGLVGVLCFLVSGAVYSEWSQWKFKTEQAEAIAQATREVDDALDPLYDDQARQAIQAFESVNRSDGTDEHPELLAQVMTGRVLEEQVITRKSFLTYRSTTEPFLISSKDVHVAGVDVLEYSPERLKVLACITETSVETSPSGQVLNETHRQDIVLYVFHNENNSWKVAGYFGIWYWEAAIRDWDYEPPWEKQIIGDLPIGRYPSCGNEPPTP